MLDWGYTVEGEPDTAPVRLTAEADDAAFDAHYAARARVRRYLLEGYRRLRPVDEAWAELVEPLMAMRRLWFDAWTWARRDDPGFEGAPSGASTEAWNRRLRDWRRRVARLSH